MVFERYAHLPLPVEQVQPQRGCTVRQPEQLHDQILQRVQVDALRHLLVPSLGRRFVQQLQMDYVRDLARVG